MTYLAIMKNRRVSTASFDCDDDNNNNGLQNLESIAVSTLFNKFDSPLSNVGLINLPDDAWHHLPLPSVAMGGGSAANYDGSYESDINDRKRPHDLLTPDEAANVVDAALDDFQLITPPPTPERRPAKKARRSSGRRQATKTKRVPTAARSSSSSIPTADDPMDESFLMKLYKPRDLGRINPAHIIVRRDILEVRRTVSGRIFFQCGCCAHVPRADRAKLSTLAPQSVDNLYRSMVRFMMNHVRACDHVPQEIKELSPKSSRVVTERGTKKYWAKSARKMGLMDGTDGKSIVYCSPVNTKE